MPDRSIDWLIDSWIIIDGDITMTSGTTISKRNKINYFLQIISDSAYIIAKIQGFELNRIDARKIRGIKDELETIKKSVADSESVVVEKTIEQDEE